MNEYRNIRNENGFQCNNCERTVGKHFEIASFLFFFFWYKENKIQNFIVQKRIILFLKSHTLSQAIECENVTFETLNIKPNKIYKYNINDKTHIIKYKFIFEGKWMRETRWRMKQRQIEMARWELRWQALQMGFKIAVVYKSPYEANSIFHFFPFSHLIIRFMFAKPNSLRRKRNEQMVDERWICWKYELLKRRNLKCREKSRFSVFSSFYFHFREDLQEYSQ